MKKFIHFFSILCALALSPSFGGGWGEVVAQVNLTFSAPLTQGGTVVASSSITLKPGFRFAASPGNNLSLKINANASTPYASGTPALSQDQNYILTRTYKTDDGAGYMDQIQYFDGLGRPTQAVQAGASPSGADLVTYQEYDGFGRESNAWLPHPAGGNNGAFVPLASFTGLPADGYNGDTAPYFNPVYEPSPLNRVQEQFGPGQEWRTNGKSVKTEYLTNNADYPCIMFSVASAGLTQVSNYPAGELYVTKTTDEGGSVSYEFKDKLGQVVLTRQVDKGNNHDTYYVYDDLGNKRYVLPPIAVDSLSRGLGDDSDMMKRYAYIYKYDRRNRCIQKRIPGCDWIYYVYDKADRLIFTQDGEYRKSGAWTFSFPDKMNRIAVAGILKDTQYDIEDEVGIGFLDIASSTSIVDCVRSGEIVLNAKYDVDSNKYLIYVTSGDLFDSNPIGVPMRLYIDSCVVLNTNIYDNYNFVGKGGFPNYIYEADKESDGYGKRYNSAQGLLTGTVTSILDDPNKRIYAVSYYDYRGRIVQTKSTNHLGGIEAEYIAYDFTGHPTQKKHVHTSPQAGTVTELYTYVYDHAGRPTETRHSLNGGAEQLLAKLSYDELGRLQNHKAGNASVVNTTYGYNVRSWTTGINGSKFKEELVYNYDGNIKQQTFGDNSTYSIRYDFLYDDLSRLTDATSSSISGSYGTNDAYGCHYRYDKQGNATNITTNGTKWVTDRKTMLSTIKSVNYDALALAYNGNQLRKVSDAADVSTNSITEQFLEFARTDIEYAYNANGAMIKDLNKGISKIEYNLLNLPQQVDILSPLAEARNNYSYSADGVKLRVVKKYNSTYNASPIIGSAVNLSSMNVTKTTDYVGNKIFENGTLDRIFVDGGYIKGGVYYFYETDHLGDNRTVINQSGTIVERNDYYPYGMQMAHNQLTNSASGSDNKRKFSGKELDVMHGLNMYDFSARSQDPTLGRFTTVDPKAEKYYSWSPYAYCGNNPIRLVDVNGKEWGIIVNANGTMTITLNTTISSGSNLNLTAAQLDAYKTRISTQLNSTISEASGGLISASISFDGAKDPSRYTPNIVLEGGSGDMALGMSVGGSKFVRLNEEKAESLAEFGETATHELLHTLTLSDVADNPNILDTKMTKKTLNGITEYFTTESTDKNIRSNVMNYGSAKIDGLSYRDIYHSGSGMNKLTKGQLSYIIRQIYKQMQGYGVMPLRNTNESQNEYDKKVDEYYWDYWNQ